MRSSEWSFWPPAPHRPKLIPNHPFHHRKSNREYLQPKSRNFDRCYGQSMINRGAPEPYPHNDSCATEAHGRPTRERHGASKRYPHNGLGATDAYAKRSTCDRPNGHFGPQLLIDHNSSQIIHFIIENQTENLSGPNQEFLIV